MITLEQDRLVFRFPDVHEDAVCSVGFQRTLRIPDDGRSYPLPPGFGRFPLVHVEDFAGRVPEHWNARGGVMLPMHQAEAMWLQFDGSYPFALKIAAGKINAITGGPWSPELQGDPQDYAVVTEQPWLDGFCVDKGVIRQFVAMPLGEGFTVEEQISGAATHGGLQIIAYPMRADAYAKWRESRYEPVGFQDACESLSVFQDMGLAAGGRMRQEISADTFGIDVWDQKHSSRCFVAIANSKVWQQVTGSPPPIKPPGAAEYAEAGLPWFEYYGDGPSLPSSPVLAKIKSVADFGQQAGKASLVGNESVTPKLTIGLAPAPKLRLVNEGPRD